MSLEVLSLFFPFAMLYAAAMDVFTMRIRNYVSIAIAAAFPVVALIAGLPAHQVLMHFGIGAAVMLLTMALFAFNLMGGGDAKLIPAAAVWMGYEQILPFLVYMTLFGGALSLFVVFYRSFPAAALPLPQWALRLHQPGYAIPYGVAIAAGALIAYPLTTVAMALAN
ncbi:prepilin peptidase [Hyphomicrobium sp. D-2]|uniref:A24 family peptidase n=1 Tax=Hyphomicrobium sp. D-2 TaxID=3041621 RepID=UPI00245766CC|nr:prepilin peptidase [Hyphomicrobium sp. D-2]MDH4980970.1 prepilin peptidase [Hyphomicrobium sp. D-2]